MCSAHAWRVALVGLFLLAGCVPVPPQVAGQPGGASAADAPLVAQRVSVAPISGVALDPAWAQAQPLVAALTWGSHGSAHALDVELRALHTADTLFLQARWPGDAPAGPADATYTRLTWHWRIPAVAGQPPPACEVACHTAHVTGNGDLAYIHAETIPPGAAPALPATGGWHDGVWTISWSRPLRNGNAYDLQFDDLGRGYGFFVKVFQDDPARPDPVSALRELRFAR